MYEYVTGSYDNNSTVALTEINYSVGKTFVGFEKSRTFLPRLAVKSGWKRISRQLIS